MVLKLQSLIKFEKLIQAGRKGDESKVFLMDTFILVLIPWLIGKLLATLPISQQLICRLRQRHPQKVGWKRTVDSAIGCCPLFLTIIVCLWSAEKVISKHGTDFTPYLLRFLLFSILFFISTVWLNITENRK